MNLIYFTKDAYKLLKKDLDANKDNYYRDDPWLSEYFAKVGLDEFYKTSSIVVSNLQLNCSGDDVESKNNDDLLNIKLLYSDYKDKITPLQASDPLLWSALCHIPFKEYVLKRWKKDDGTVRLDQRFFATEGRASLLYYNAISRLWWSGYLTYDETRASSNPWHLTETLFSAQQIQKDLFDQSFSMNRTVVKGLLSALKTMQEENGNKCTTIFRACCDSYINHYGAVSILDTLSADDIETIAYNYMKKLVKTTSTN
ncbi:MAG TPA: hypothetical protein IAA90_07030 [Candidatus Ornithoclostridium excrementipullorum]|nr:hypothetical protein [Candidatus Ornithoclostridium excrementipullorum]